MTIQHRPILPVKKVEELYTKKDGVPVTYVCTSALGGEAQAMDIFYRDTPHPEFGNRYFGLYRDMNGILMITNADKIKDVEFDMLEYNGECHYSQHRHDFYTVGNVAIDGGRAYTRIVGNIGDSIGRKTFRVRDGVFYELS